jgi:hypothetical protein
VSGGVLGYAAGQVTAQVSVVSPGDTAGDVTAPTLTLTPSGSAGTGGWFRSAVTVRVAAADDRGGRMTIASTVDGGAPASASPVRYSDVVVAGDGQHTVAATATDRAGNVSAAAGLPVRIDATAPSSTATIGGRSVTLAAADATSGVARIEYAVDTGAWNTYTGPVAAPDPNKHTVSFRALDNAGNTETAKTATIAADLSGPLSGNVGPIAVPTASYTAGWNSVTALNDNADPPGPAQAQIWGTWSGTRPATQWVQYDWGRPIRLTGAELKFWKDSDPGTGDGVAAPDGWKLQSWDGTAWQDVAGVASYGTSTTAFNTVSFPPVTTSRLRATVDANGNGTTYSAVAITEWRVFADDPGTVPAVVPVTVTVQPRCIAGKAYLAVRAHNDHDSAVDLAVGTAYGDRAFVAVAPGANAYQSFAVRAASVPAGTVTVRATGTVGGRSITTTITADHGTLTC